ncbi:MAG: rhodanese-like domain-containing protein [Alphaproteobacteria bacterium]|nr:rhodanese-like domain-containing protein [Alphaproteobacteria bacterium]
MSWFDKLFGGATPAGPGNRVNGQRARELVGLGAQLLDVRTPMEFRGGHVQGATNIPVDELGRRLDELDQARPVVVYCRSGARSHRASGLLQHAGFAQVWDLGPISAW